LFLSFSFLFSFLSVSPSSSSNFYLIFFSSSSFLYFLLFAHRTSHFFLVICSILLVPLHFPCCTLLPRILSVSVHFTVAHSYPQKLRFVSTHAEECCTI
jgi:hypothetical protein